MDKTQPISQHLNELRTYILRAGLGVILASFASYAFSKQILSFLRAPMRSSLGDKAQFVVLAPAEYFFTEVKVAIVAGIFIASPWIFYQLWLFIAPGLYKYEKKYIFTFVFFGAFFFVTGALFSYLTVFPVMFEFFINTLPAEISGTYSVGYLFSFALNMLFAFGLVFEVPVVVFLLVILGIVEVSTLKEIRRYIIVGAFIIGAILTPTPDPLTQTFMAVPMILLYEFGLLAAKIFLKK